MKKILLATDFSERSDRALRRAMLLARQFDASLSIVHVIDDDQPRRVIDSERDVASELLRDLQNMVQSEEEIPCETRVIQADPFAGIVAATREDAPDLVVIGPHRRQTLRDVFVGTTAERTIRSVACPVLMVNAPPMGTYVHAMLTTDLSASSERAAKVYKKLGIARDAEVTILHVFDPMAVHLAMSHTMSKDDKQAYLDDERKEAFRSLSKFVELVDLRSVQQNVRQLRNSTAEDILIAAREESADLVVVGTHGRSGAARFFLGSVAEVVLRTAECDVLAVPSESA